MVLRYVCYINQWCGLKIIQNGDEVLDGGRFIEPEIIGIIKKRSGICKGENRVAY